MIRAEGLSKSYLDATVVDGVSFDVAEGEVLAVVGASGSGKSTLLKMINRLIEPSAGRVLIAGRDAASVEPHLLRRRIGFVLQNHGLFPHRTVAENVATTPRLLRWDEARIAARVAELLEALGLDPAVYGARKPHQLSGGEQQRVGVARALAAEPPVLLMDEPFGALDPVVRTKAQEDLESLRRRYGVTIVIVTHDIDEAMRLGNQVAVMERGRLVQIGSPAELLRRPATASIAKTVGRSERALRLLSVGRVSSIVSEGSAIGEPVSAEADLREALAELVWSGRSAAPVRTRDGRLIGVVTLDALLRAGAERPA